MAECRTCHAPVVWTWTENGKRLAVDKDPVPAGTILLRYGTTDDDTPVAHVTTKEERAKIDETLRELNGGGGTLLLYRAHFATCPDADKHRRR